jgi:hypothetical protein
MRSVAIVTTHCSGSYRCLRHDVSRTSFHSADAELGDERVPDKGIRCEIHDRGNGQTKLQE